MAFRRSDTGYTLINQSLKNHKTRIYKKQTKVKIFYLTCEKYKNARTK